MQWFIYRHSTVGWFILWDMLRTMCIITRYVCRAVKLYLVGSNLYVQVEQRLRLCRRLAFSHDLVAQLVKGAIYPRTTCPPKVMVVKSSLLCREHVRLCYVGKKALKFMCPTPRVTMSREQLCASQSGPFIISLKGSSYFVHFHFSPIFFVLYVPIPFPGNFLLIPSTFYFVFLGLCSLLHFHFLVGFKSILCCFEQLF